MTREEAIKVFHKIRKLFADWKPNKDQTAEWVSAVETIAMYHLGESAASILYSTCGYPSPSLEAFHAAVQVASTRAPEVVHRDDGPRESGWVICIENDECPNRVGYAIPVIAPGQHLEGQAAEQMCDRFAGRQALPRAFAGRWAACPGWTRQQVMAKSLELRDAAGFKRPEPSAVIMALLKRWLGQQEQTNV